jgi:hypothetical protein
MSNDKKAIISLQKKVVLPSFQKEIKRLREKYDVPPDGFETKEEVDDWDKKRNDELMDFLFEKKSKKRIFDDYDENIFKCLDEHKMTPAMFPLLTNYIASNKVENIDSGSYACAIDIDQGPFQRINENHWKKHGKRFVKLLISEDAESSDAKRYVDEHWDSIRAHMGVLQKKNATLKESPEWNRDQIIFKLSRKKKKELIQMLRKSDAIYINSDKRTIIGQLIKYSGYDPMTFEAVKKAIERQLKKRKSDN